MAERSRSTDTNATALVWEATHRLELSQVNSGTCEAIDPLNSSYIRANNGVFILENQNLSGMSNESRCPGFMPGLSDRKLPKSDNVKNIPSTNKFMTFQPGEGVAFSAMPRFLPTPYHYRSFIELLYAYRGEIKVSIGSHEILLHKGDMILYNPNVVYQLEPGEESDIAVLCRIKKQYCDSFLLNNIIDGDDNHFVNFLLRSFQKDKKTEEYYVFRNSKNLRIGTYFEYAADEYFTRRHCSIDAIQAFISLLFIEMARAQEGESGWEFYTRGLTVSKIISYIRKNFKTASLRSTADYFNFSPNYLSRMLKEQTGKGFLEILTEERLKAAANLLTNTDLPVVKIADRVGYQNINFLYTIFKQRYGCTLSEYHQRRSNSSTMSNIL